VDKPAVAELQQWARASLRSSRVPGRIVFAESLPYGDSGKLLRRTLRTSYANQSTMAGDPS
jgi:acyl-coenzyme A synthetase/AMP-(fatty) acid ligase